VYHLLWFLHITGVVLWVGGLATTAVLLLGARRQSEVIRNHVVPFVTRYVTRGTHLGAALVLIGGIPMLWLIPHHTLTQFWIQYMGGVGILAVILSFFMFTETNRTLRKSDVDSAAVVKAAHTYMRWLAILLLLSLSVLVVVAFKV
jgi:drug/metabolite transporter (DMT)-like permease